MYSVEGKRKYLIERKNGQWSIDGEQFAGSIKQHSDTLFTVSKDHKTFIAEVEDVSQDGKTLSIRVGKTTYQLQVKDRLDMLIEQMGLDPAGTTAADNLYAPMPGLIIDILVKPGDKVAEGESLLILEAMKMENVLKASHDVEVKDVLVEKGQSVEKNQVLISF